MLRLNPIYNLGDDSENADADSERLEEVENIQKKIFRHQECPIKILIKLFSYPKSSEVFDIVVAGVVEVVGLGVVFDRRFQLTFSSLSVHTQRNGSEL